MSYVALLIICIILMPLSAYLIWKSAPLMSEAPLPMMSLMGLYALPFIFAGWSAYQLTTDQVSKKI